MVYFVLYLLLINSLRIGIRYRYNENGKLPTFSFSGNRSIGRKVWDFKQLVTVDPKKFKKRLIGLYSPDVWSKIRKGVAFTSHFIIRSRSRKMNPKQKKLLQGSFPKRFLGKKIFLGSECLLGIAFG